MHVVVWHLLGSLQAHGGTPTPNENVGCDYCLCKNLRKLALSGVKRGHGKSVILTIPPP